MAAECRIYFQKDKRKTTYFLGQITLSGDTPMCLLLWVGGVEPLCCCLWLPAFSFAMPKCADVCGMSEITWSAWLGTAWTCTEGPSSSQLGRVDLGEEKLTVSSWGGHMLLLDAIQGCLTGTWKHQSPCFQEPWSRVPHLSPQKTEPLGGRTRIPGPQMMADRIKRPIEGTFQGTCLLRERAKWKRSEQF